MRKNHKLAKIIADAGWTMFLNMTAYKAERADKPFVLVRPAGIYPEMFRVRHSGAKDLAEKIQRSLRCGLLLIETTTRPSKFNVG